MSLVKANRPRCCRIVENAQCYVKMFTPIERTRLKCFTSLVLDDVDDDDGSDVDMSVKVHLVCIVPQFAVYHDGLAMHSPTFLSGIKMHFNKYISQWQPSSQVRQHQQLNPAQMLFKCGSLHNNTNYIRIACAVVQMLLSPKKGKEKSQNAEWYSNCDRILRFVKCMTYE